MIVNCVGKIAAKHCACARAYKCTVSKGLPFFNGSSPLFVLQSNFLKQT